MALIEVSTLEGWVDVLYRACDIVGADMGRCRNANLIGAAMFFVVYIFVCAFFALNLFMSVVIENFSAEIAKQHSRERRMMKFIQHIQVGLLAWSSSMI